jgi:hypothetical protein
MTMIERVARDTGRDPLTRSLTYVVPKGRTTRFARNPLSSLRDRARKSGLAPPGFNRAYGA